MTHFEISPEERYDEEERYRREFEPFYEEEYAPAQIDDLSEGAASRPVNRHCINCWMGGLVSGPGAICGHCGRPQDISEMEWLRLRYAPLTCERCGHECRDEDEGACPECAGKCRVAA